MNGEQQKELATAITRLENTIAQMEVNTITLINGVLQANREDNENLKSVFAKMLDDETTWRKRDVQVVRDEIMALARAVVTFVHLPWWKRYLWMLIGPRVLDWFPVYRVKLSTDHPEPIPSAMKGSINRKTTSGEKPQ